MNTAAKPWHLPERPVVVESNLNDDPTKTNNDNAPQASDETKTRQRTPLSRDQILDATQICLSELGYDGTTIRKIASQLGCAVGSIYRYFKDKRDLLAAVTQRRFQPVIELSANPQTLPAAVEKYIELAASEPEQYRLMFWLASLSDTQAERPLPAIIEQILATWAQQTDASADQIDEAWCTIHGGLMIGIKQHDLAGRVLRRMGVEPASRPVMLPKSPVVVDAAPAASEAQVG
ncbi:TetR/AcrR family transcriptional regulator [Mucisphaera calidilacus]|uniref:HTH-type transcriptional repressor KstR n=1 Tax=Mucisphaera calidilacus TaxID=2527982 RepID=A0A518BV77_9BACT|nr:TetR/AcrR family transcriptional regulator [Mucisphaera calidilacus]QDU70890.1 HTH-type transcriptional repressor KstR [Mucisphaera calidilacus]